MCTHTPHPLTGLSAGVKVLKRGALPWEAAGNSRPSTLLSARKTLSVRGYSLPRWEQQQNRAASAPKSTIGAVQSGPRPSVLSPTLLGNDCLH